MKPYLFLSGLLLGTSISMSSLMADTRVLNAYCNDARFGACTSDQTSILIAVAVQVILSQQLVDSGVPLGSSQCRLVIPSALIGPIFIA